MNNQEYFLKIRGDYQAAVDSMSESARNLGAMLDGVLSGKVVDFGSGGVMLYGLDNLHSVLCVDLIHEQQAGEGKVRSVYGDFYDYEFPRDADYVLAQFLLHHLPDDARLDAALRRLADALRPNGRFVIVEIALPRAVEALQNLLRPLTFWLLHLIGKPGLRFFSRTSLESRLRAAGFSDFSTQTVEALGWIAPAAALFPRLRIPGWLFPFRCVLVVASTSRHG